MKQTIAVVVTALAVGLLSTGAWADTVTTPDQYLEQLIVQSADTPAEHEALARYYSMKAADAKSVAATHRTMAKNYKGKPGPVAQMKQHCEQIAKLNDDLAAQYESLAAGERAAAKQ